MARTAASASEKTSNCWPAPAHRSSGCHSTTGAQSTVLTVELLRASGPGDCRFSPVSDVSRVAAVREPPEKARGIGTAAWGASRGAPTSNAGCAVSSKAAARKSSAAFSNHARVSMIRCGSSGMEELAFALDGRRQRGLQTPRGNGRQAVWPTRSCGGLVSRPTCSSGRAGASTVVCPQYGDDEFTNASYDQSAVNAGYPPRSIQPVRSKP